MLNLFKIYYNKKAELKIIKPQEKHDKHYPSAVREWKNSIYVYNKNTINLIPQVTILAIKLIKGYFNLYNHKIERKIRTSRLLGRLRRLSSHKIYISNGEFKHTNNKVIITLYLFNRQLFNLKKKFVKSFYKSFWNKNLVNKRLYILLKKKQLIESKVIRSLDKLNKKKVLVISRLESHVNNKEIFGKKNFSRYLAIFHKKLIEKSLDKILLYYYYKQLFFINESKFDYHYLHYLKKYLEKIYNKNVEFNLVNLRRFYLNSDILSESITLKITKNRRKLLKFLNIIKRKVIIHNKKSLFYTPNLTRLNTDTNKKSIQRIVLQNIKYKHVTGFRLQANGRLTRRYTASRSLSKLIYKGNLLNIDSSYKGLSSVLLKGNLKSNIQYTKLKSKTRIGSFGIKGWVSSY